MSHSSPRLAIWLLTKRLAPEWREFVLGDLEEEFATRGAESLAAAYSWLWWQTFRCLVAPPPAHRAALRNEPSRGDGRMRRVLADLRYALRFVTRTPSFALTVVGVLALGIGANTALFSIVNAVLLRPLPFEEPDRLVRLYTRTPSGNPFDVAPGKFYDWQRDAHSFERMAMYPCCGLREMALTGTGTARAVRAEPVSAGFFDIVGARPALGRLFRPDEDTPGASHVVVLSDRFWRAQFGADPDVIGRTMNLSDEPYMIVGIMPPEASVASWPPMASDLWIPLALSADERASRQNHNMEGIARLRPGVELAQAQAELDGIAKRLAREFPKTDDRWGAAVLPLQQAIVGDSRTMLLMMLGAVALVLLIACANVGNLLFTRTLNRRKEIAIRVALGAGRGHVFQQLLSEALLLATLGGAVGLLIAYAALRAAAPLLAEYVPRASEISIDAHVLIFALTVSLLTGVLAGVLPALRTARSDLQAALNAGGRGNGVIGVRTRRVLIVCEVALSVVLLMGAGVMIRSLVALRQADTGFDASNVLTMKVRLIEARYPAAAQRSAFFNMVLDRIRTLPGVEAAGSIDDLPFIDGEAQPLQRQEWAEGARDGRAVVHVRQITPGYLRAMRIPVLRGRDVARRDADVLLVSPGAAKLVWGADDPMGQEATLPLMSKTTLRRVVGVVGDIKQDDPSQSLTPTAYYYSAGRDWSSATLVVRTSRPSITFARSIVAVIHSIDAEQPVEDIRTMEQVVDSKLTSQRFSTLLLAVFAAAALLLASVGIYGVLSYIVRGRTREIGIRTALGARTSDVLLLVVIEAMSPTLIGIVVGAAIAMASGRLLKSLVYGVSASDPLTLACVTATLALMALLASILPAYRASRFDPVTVLRAE